MLGCKVDKITKLVLPLGPYYKCLISFRGGIIVQLTVIYQQDYALRHHDNGDVICTPLNLVSRIPTEICVWIGYVVVLLTLPHVTPIVLLRCDILGSIFRLKPLYEKTLCNSNSDRNHV